MGALGHLALEDGEPERDVDGDPKPPANAPAAITHVGAPAARAANWGGIARGHRTQATSGLRGRWRIAATPPAMAPMPATVRIAAQAPAPPRRSLATAGPRTCMNTKKTLPTPNRSTVDHSHVRAVNSRQPARSSCTKRCGLALGARRDAHPRQQRRAHEEGRAVDGERPAGVQGDQEDAAQRGADDPHAAARQALQRVGLLQARRADGLRHETRLGRDDEPVAHSPHDAEHGQQRHRRDARQHDGGRRRLRRALHERGADQHEVAPRAIGQHAPEDQHRRARTLADGDHDPQRRRTGDVEHRERERDRPDGRPERRRQRRAEQQPVLALAQRSQPLAESSAGHRYNDAPSPPRTPPGSGAELAARAYASAAGGSIARHAPSA